MLTKQLIQLMNDTEEQLQAQGNIDDPVAQDIIAAQQTIRESHRQHLQEGEAIIQQLTQAMQSTHQMAKQLGLTRPSSQSETPDTEQDPLAALQAIQTNLNPKIEAFEQIAKQAIQKREQAQAAQQQAAKQQTLIRNAVIGAVVVVALIAAYAAFAFTNGPRIVPPHKSRLAMITRANETNELVIMNTSGTIYTSPEARLMYASPSDEKIAFVNGDDMLEILDWLETPLTKRTIASSSAFYGAVLNWSPDEQYIAVNSVSEEVMFFDLETNTVHRSPIQYRMQAIDWSAGQNLAVYYRDNASEFVVIDLETMEAIQTQLPDGPQVADADMRFSPDGQYLSYRTDNPKSIWLYSRADDTHTLLVSSDSISTRPISWDQGGQYVFYWDGGAMMVNVSTLEVSEEDSSLRRFSNDMVRGDHDLVDNVNIDECMLSIDYGRDEHQITVPAHPLVARWYRENYGYDQNSGGEGDLACVRQAFWAEQVNSLQGGHVDVVESSYDASSEEPMEEAMDEEGD